MWRCTQCAEEVEDTFDLCWNCSADRELSAAPVQDSPVPSEPESDGLENAELQPASHHGSGMNRREIAEMACKTIALILFAQSIFLAIASLLYPLVVFVHGAFYGWVDQAELLTAMIIAVPGLATMVTAALYWWNARKIAGRMVSSDPTAVSTVAISAQDVMMVAFSTVGVWSLINGVRHMVLLVFIAHESGASPGDFWLSSNTAAAIVHVGLSLWLILGSPGIVRLIFWLRTAGTPLAE